MTSIEIKSVSKSFGQVQALKNVSIGIPENCLFGLIGPDGAGKTTLFRIITTLLLPDTGTVSVLDLDTLNDYKKIRKFTGYMPGRFSLYMDLTVEENLNFYATIFGTTLSENYHLIKPVFSLLEPYKNRLAGKLSGGMKQKLALSCAMIHNPKILVLDEPTTGVDAVSRKEFWETLKMLKESGMTILVSTPYMDEAAQCDQVALMQEGVIMEYDTPHNILASFKRPLFEVRSEDLFNLLKHLRSMEGVKSAYLFGECIHITLKSEDYNGNWLKERLESIGYHRTEITPVASDIEDCFIEAVEKHND